MARNFATTVETLCNFQPLALLACFAPFPIFPRLPLAISLHPPNLTALSSDAAALAGPFDPRPRLPPAEREAALLHLVPVADCPEIQKYYLRSLQKISAAPLESYDRSRPSLVLRSWMGLRMPKEETAGVEKEQAAGRKDAVRLKAPRG